MSLLVLGDAHIKTAEDCERMSLFIKGCVENRGVDEIILLGDIFDFWFSYRGYVHSKYFSVYELFLFLKERKIRVNYVAGNHDFALGTFFKDTFGMYTFEKCDFKTVFYKGHGIAISHGDRVVKDGLYHAFSTLLNLRVNQFLFSLLPPWVGEYLAKTVSTKSREASSKHNRHASPKFKQYMYELKKNMVSYAAKHECDFAFVGHSHENTVEFAGGVNFVNTGCFGWYSDAYILSFDENENGDLIHIFEKDGKEIEEQAL